MATAIRWLRWNGVYDVAGICNRKLTPLDSPAEQLKAIKERLYILGFDCGSLDNSPNNESKDALITFNCYWNHPNFRKWLPPARKADPPPAVPAPAAPYYDQDTIKCLKEIDEVIQPASPSGKAASERRKLDVSRSRRERSGGVDLTLNSASALAIKIVSAPDSLSPFAEFAAIELEIRGFELMRSLMIRIYRNFDPKTDANAIPGARMVYQEILDSDAIESLPEKGVAENKGSHHPAKAYIMRQVIGGGMNGGFGNYLGVAYERLHAPYKVRVWASTKDKFFEKYAFTPTGSTKSRKISKSDVPSLHYLEDKPREEVRRRRKVALANTGTVQDEFHLIEPDINHVDSVHDKSNIVKADKSEAIRFYWHEIEKSNAALARPKYWTKADQHQINLIAHPCPTHNSRFLIDNQIEMEMLPNIFVKNPVEVYWELRGRLDRDGENFKYTELSEVFANVERHINIIKRRLCCGQWSHVGDNIKSDALSTIDFIETRAQGLKSGSFPYNDSLIFLNSFMSFFSYVVHKAVVQDELKFYETCDLQKGNQPRLTDLARFPDYLRDRRNNIDGCRSPAQSEYGMLQGHHFHNSIQSRPFFDVLGTVFSYLKVKEGVDSFMDYSVRKIGKVILLPSYNPLDAYFFVKIRAVPMYMVGMLDMQYLGADGIRQIPIGFFEHDCFHVASPRSGGTQQWRTLYKRLCELIDASAPPVRLTERQVYDKWQDNVKMIDQIMAVNGGNKRETLGFLLFWLLHEPKSGTVLPYLQSRGVASANIAGLIDSFPSPATPEPTLLTDRLNHAFQMSLQNIRQEDSTDFFGSYSHPFMADLDWAAQTVDNPLVPLLDYIG